MKLLLILLLNLFYLFASLTQQLQVIKIGSIFFDNEVELMNAFDLAINQLNALELNIELRAVKHYLAIDNSINLQLLACDLIESGVSAILGPSSQATSNIVETLCNITGIPHLQFDYRQYDQLYLEYNRKMTVNVAPSESMLSMALFDILRNKDFDWKSFTIIYESKTNLARMQHLLAWKNLHKSSLKLRSFDRNGDYRILWKYISSIKEKFVLLHCPADILVDVVNASIYFNMTGQFNNLFLSDLDTHTGSLFQLYSSEFSATTTAVRLRTFQPTQVHDETDVFEDADEEKLVSLRAQLVYDAVILFFNAVRNMTKTLRFHPPRRIKCLRDYWSTGAAVIAEMKTINTKHTVLPFKTQKVHLNEFGERDDFNLEIYNPMTERITHVWNRNHQLVSYDSLVENSTKKAQKQRLEIKEDFSQKRVRFTVSTRVGEPYFMWRVEPEGVHYEGNERFEGYAVDLIYKLAEECKFDFIFEPVADNKYGAYDAATDEWNGIIRELIDNNAQIGICDLTITQARRSVVDFTVPFMQLGVSILHYKGTQPSKNLFAFLKPYAFEVWLYLLVCLLIFSLLLLVTARISQADWEKPPPPSQIVGIIENKWCLRNTLWLMIGSIMTTGCDLLPRGSAMRFFTAFWWIFAMVISQTYIAKLAAFITTSKMDDTLRNLHDLVDQNKIQFGTIKGGSTSLFFSESNETDYRLAWNKMIAMKPEAFTMSNQEGVDRVKRSRGRYAFLMETTSLQYHLQRNCELTQIGVPFGEKLYGIAVPLNAPFRSNLSVGILKLSEKGELYTLKNKWFNNNETECTYHRGGETYNNAQFDMNSVGGLFIVLIAGMLMALLIGICEFLWNVHKTAVKERVAPMIILKSELSFFLCFWLTRKPLKTFVHKRNSTLTGYSSFEQITATATATATVPSIAKRKQKQKKKNSKKT